MAQIDTKLNSNIHLHAFKALIFIDCTCMWCLSSSHSQLRWYQWWLYMSFNYKFTWISSKLQHESCNSSSIMQIPSNYIHACIYGLPIQQNKFKTSSWPLINFEHTILYLELMNSRINAYLEAQSMVNSRTRLQIPKFESKITQFSPSLSLTADPSLFLRVWSAPVKKQEGMRDVVLLHNKSH